MVETTVGVREFKNHLGEYLRRVKAGESVVITDRGKPIGRIIPQHAEPTLEDKIWALVAARKANWSGKKLRPPRFRVKAPDGFSLSDVIIQERDESTDMVL